MWVGKVLSLCFLVGVGKQTRKWKVEMGLWGKRGFESVCCSEGTAENEKG